MGIASPSGRAGRLLDKPGSPSMCPAPGTPGRGCRIGTRFPLKPKGCRVETFADYEAKAFGKTKLKMKLSSREKADNIEKGSHASNNLSASNLGVS